MWHERWKNRCMMKQTCMMETHALSTKHHDANSTMTYVTKCTPGTECSTKGRVKYLNRL
nr:hypothetical protein Q903MT_gene6248 [Picea sitchensis]